MRALFGDGASFFLYAVHQDWFVHFYPARDYAMVASQLPLILALKLGLDDPATLARVFCLGVFGLPAAIWHLALARARHDKLLLALVIASIALVFMPASFCAVSESIPANAIAVASAIWLATANRSRLAAGFMVMALAAFALRAYESFLYLGPPLAAMAFTVAQSIHGSANRSGNPSRRSLWPWLVLATIAATGLAVVGRYAVVFPLALLTIGLAATAWRRPTARPLVATLLYVTAAALFAAGAVVALWSIVDYLGGARMAQVTMEIFDVWTNPPLLLALGAAATLAAWALIRPADLASGRPFKWAGLWLVLLAFFPSLALAIGDTEFRPTAFGQCSSRIAGGPLTLAVIVVLWICRPAARPAWIAPAQSRLLVFAVLALLAMLPTDIFLTRAWSDYFAVLKDVVRHRSGIVMTDRTAVDAWPHMLMADSASITCQSLIVRTRPADAVIAPAHDDAGWRACSPGDADRITRFFWRGD
jgi:hypothetical protein